MSIVFLEGENPPTIDELLERLRKHFEDSLRSKWSINPDGPEAATALETLAAQSAQLQNERDQWKEQANILRNRCQSIEILLGEHVAQSAKDKARIKELEEELDAYRMDGSSAANRIAELEAQVEESAFVSACENCGSMDSLEAIRKKHPDAVSCCPERKMLTLGEWRRRCLDAEAQVEAFREALAKCMAQMRYAPGDTDPEGDAATDAAYNEADALMSALKKTEVGK